MYKLTNVWVGNGVVEITSTDQALLKSAVDYIKDKLNINYNKIIIKNNDLIPNRIVNITIEPLDEKPTDAFMLFWAINSYLCEENGWKPNGITPDTFSFIKEE